MLLNQGDKKDVRYGINSYSKQTRTLYRPSLPPAHEEVEDDEDKHDEADEVVHVPGAARREHGAEFRNRVREEIRGGPETVALIIQLTLKLIT